MAAENLTRRAMQRSEPCGFNEAAAHGRGKRPHGPRVDCDAHRFNEAAAHGRGKRTLPTSTALTTAISFNEAAAHGRGKLPCEPRPCA